jgi:hypothetical protein
VHRFTDEKLTYRDLSIFWMHGSAMNFPKPRFSGNDRFESPSSHRKPTSRTDLTHPRGPEIIMASCRRMLVCGIQ